MEQTFFVLFFISAIFHNAKTRCTNGYYSKKYMSISLCYISIKHPLLGFFSSPMPLDKKSNGRREKKSDYLFIINPLCIFVKWHAIINGGLECDVFLTQRSSSLRKHESQNNIIFSRLPIQIIIKYYI